MAYDLSNLKIVQDIDSDGYLTFKLTGMPKAEANYWHKTEWSYKRTQGEDTEWHILQEEFGTQGDRTETPKVTLYTSVENTYLIECDYVLQDEKGEQVADALLYEYYTIGGDIALGITGITATEIKLQATANSAIATPIDYCDWYVYVNGRNYSSAFYEVRTLNFAETITGLTPNTEYEIYVEFAVYLGNAKVNIYQSDYEVVKTLEKIQKAYIYTTKDEGKTYDWYSATPYIYKDNTEKWVKATPYIYNGSEWK